MREKKKLKLKIDSLRVSRFDIVLLFLTIPTLSKLILVSRGFSQTYKSHALRHPDSGQAFEDHTKVLAY